MKLVLRNRLLVIIMLVVSVWGDVMAQKTYVVCVGLNNYDNGENPLPCSIGDAKGMAAFFKSYNNSDVFMLLDKNATRDHILRVLKAKFSKASSQDQIIFAYSGHGFDGGISCYDTKNIIYCSEIQQILRSCKARRKIMFINSCHSGSFSKKYGNRNGRNDYKSKNSNVLLYLSSRANEYSWESSGMRMSYFYTRLIEALNGHADKNGDNLVTAREMFNYVNANVIKDMQGQQHPQMYGKFPDDMIIVKVK